MTSDTLDLCIGAPAADLILPELPPSVWLSLGKRFDYAGWEDRDRFMELDRALLACQGADRGYSGRIQKAEPTLLEVRCYGRSIIRRWCLLPDSELVVR